MNYDAVIIGSGFGGSISANRLALAGLKVLVLERGPWRDSLPVRSMGIAERSPFPYGRNFVTHLLRNVHLGRGHMPELTTDERGLKDYLHYLGVGFLKALRRLPQRSGQGLRVNMSGMYEVFMYPGLDVLCVSAVGGGSHGWGGMLVEPYSETYWRNRHPDLDPAQIEQYYPKIKTDMGAIRLTQQLAVPNTIWAQLSGSAGGRCRPADEQPEMAYLFPSAENEAGQLAKDGNGALRRFCEFDGDSFLGSSKGAKASVDFIYLAPVLDNGATVRDLCEVTRVAREWSGGKTGYAVHYLDLRRNKAEVIRTHHVILAAGTMNTLRLLFAGSQGELDLGEYNLHAMPSLGRTFGGNGDFVGAWFKDSAHPSLFESPPCLGRFKVDGAESPFLVLGGTCGLDTLPLPARARRQLEKMVFFLGMGPDSGNASARFEEGRLEIDYLPAQEPIYDRIRDGLGALEADGGMKTAAIQKPISVHTWGGACLGPDPEHGVVDHNGEVYGNPGLFIADAASLPAAVGTPPTLAIAAWAHHVADRLAQRLSQRMQAPEEARLIQEEC
jgi:cholesterol oxidase